MVANYDRKVLYVGITDNLVRRIYEHKNGLANGFTKKYNVHFLVFYEIFDDPETAIEREKQIKSWNRVRKNKLIMDFNPKLEDLYSSIFA